jgi:hypothetical protein
MLLPDGERHRALEALKTLLVTRPVLYLGFSLRDPDFLYLRDLLINTFHGATRDHYAIIPDVDDEEIDYWRRQYGVRLVGYRTHERLDGQLDHGELLEMLVSLAATSAPAPHNGAAAIGRITHMASDAERTLALTRYTAGLVRLSPAHEPIETRVSLVESRSHRLARIDPFEGWATTRFLTEGPSRALLIGLPGAGKSFALRLATVCLARIVQQACLDDSINTSNLTLPVLVDLKLYQGDLHAQIEGALPAGFGLKGFLGKLRLRLFLDAFNEMPLSSMEDGSVIKSLERLRDELGDFDYVIASRTSDGLPVQDLPQYELAWFDLDHVDDALAKQGIVLSGHFEDDVRSLLSRPFFLHLVTSGRVRVPEEARPGDIYKSFLDNLQRVSTERFSGGARLTDVLSRVAYRALDTEREAFPLTWLTDQLLMFGDSSLGSVQDIVNWLIASNAVIPYSGGRISFVHQSITEYCAALELVRLSEAGEFSLRDTVALKKWDQCLFLALGMMPKSKAEEILDFLTSTDLALGFSAVRYAEEGQSAEIAKLLAVLVGLGPDAAEALSRRYNPFNLPLGAEHASYLEQLLDYGGSTAGEAIQALARIRGPSIKPFLVALLDRKRNDRNFSVNGLAPALEPFVDETDLPRLLDIAVSAASTNEDDEDETAGVAVADVLARFEPNVLIGTTQARLGSPIPPRLVKILCRTLQKRKDKCSFDILANLLLESHYEAIFALYFCLPRDEEDAAELVADLGLKHVRAIWQGRFSARSGVGSRIKSYISWITLAPTTCLRICHTRTRSTTGAIRLVLSRATVSSPRD